MKIEQTRIDPLFQQEQVEKKAPAQGGVDFSEILAQESSTAEAQGAALPPPGVLAGIDPRFSTGAATAVTASQEETAAAVSSLSSLLDELDSYATQLSGNGQLRGAYGSLEQIGTRLNAMKSDPAISGDEELSSMVNELEVLAATEQFKFNRGDYL